MKGKKINFRESECEVERKPSSQETKYMLPKLKSLSHHNVDTYSHLSLKASPHSHYPFSHERNPTEHSSTNQTEISKLSIAKIQYVSKRQQRATMNSVRAEDRSYHQPVESYVESKIKEFNKQALLDLVSSRVKTIPHNNAKLITSQQPSMNQSTMNSRISKTKLQIDKLREVRSSQKFSSLANDGRMSLKPFNTVQTGEQSRISKVGIYSKNALIQKGLILIKQKPEKPHETSSRNYNTLDHKNVEFYETKYSHFQPNKIESVKNHIKNIKKYPSLKLNLYNLH